MRDVASSGGLLWREGALSELGAAIASRPIDVGRLRDAIARVIEVGGLELAVEAAAVAGAFEAVTKIVDATGRKAFSRGLLRFLGSVMMLVKHRASICFAGAFVAAALVASRQIRGFMTS
jgi:hypothetical protein